MAQVNSDRVKRIIDFIEKLTVPSGKGEGSTFKLRQFQKDFIRDVYGPITPAGNRLVRRAILSIGRKNGKTVLIACLALVHLIGPEAVNNGEIYSAATEREQAAIVFKYAAQIVKADPELTELIKIVDSTKTMVCIGNGSIYRAISAEAGTKYGLNPTVVIYDELAQARNRDLYDALDTSMAARLEPLFIVISTQSNDPGSVLSQLIDDGLSGRDKTTICHLYAVPDDADGIFEDKKLWKMANPALGDFRSLDEMQIAAKRAQRMPTFESSFRNLYLNQRVNPNSPLIPKSEWVACCGNAEIMDGEEIYLGLDLSATEDLTALVAVSNGNNERIKAWFWKPKDELINQERRDRVPYTVWVNKGYIEAVPGRSIEYDWVANRLMEINEQYRIMGIAFDRARMKLMMSAMQRIGLDYYVEGKDAPRYGALRMVDWGQGYVSMTSAVEAILTSILNRKFIHDGNPVLTWNFANAMVIMDGAGNRKIDKSATRFRIDGAVAATMAVGLKSRDTLVVKPSIYEVTGIRTIG